MVTATLSGVSRTATIGLIGSSLAPSVMIDSPIAGATVSGMVVISGWAMESTTAVGTAISGVKVLVDGTVAGNATYGISRPDVCALWPGRLGCPNIGFAYSLNSAALSSGTHTISVIATDTRAIPNSGTATVTINIAGTPPAVFVDTPTSGSTLSGTVTVSGWALGTTSVVTSVKVLVDGAIMGAATYGASRPDVCAVWVGRPGCPNIGFTYSLNTNSLSVGGHSLGVTATDSSGVSSSWTGSFHIATSTPTVYIDGPASGSTIFGTVTISGWAIDNTTSIGTAISSVKVLVDGSNVGSASYGVSRPDVCSAFPGRPGCPHVGYAYSLNTTVLTPGPHTITVSATNSIAVTGTQSVSVIVGGSVSAGPPSVQIDSPTAGSVVSGTITVNGWAIDSTSGVGTAISAIKVLVDGTTKGTATYGVSRPDVCAAFPGRPGCPNVGYTYSLNTAGLSLGAHTLTVTATTSGASPSSGSASVPFTVTSGQTTFVDSPTAGSVVNGMLTVSGWTTERLGLTGRNSSPIHVKVDGNLVGNAVSGFARPEVCRLHLLKSAEISSADAPQTDCSAVGFAYLLDTRGLAPGSHLLTVSTPGAGSTSDDDSWAINFDVPASGGNR